jgi:hypothetical protein
MTTSLFQKKKKQNGIDMQRKNMGEYRYNEQTERVKKQFAGLR